MRHTIEKKLRIVAEAGTKGASVAMVLPCNSALIGEREWQACQERVASLGLTLPTIEAPRRNRRLRKRGEAALLRVYGHSQIP